MPNKAILLDRDGVINEVVERDGGHYSPRSFSDFKLKQGVKEFLSQIKKLDFLAIVHTNQPDIARGLMPQEELDKMHSFMKAELPGIDDIFVCPHDNQDNCHCRKPKPGMLLDAAKKWDIALGKSFLVGDGSRDIEAGKAAGVKSIILDAFYNQGVEADWRVKSWEEIVEIVR